MPGTPQVSIGMSMRNSAPTLRLSLRSLIGQSFQDWELLLFDDGSSDDSVAIARSFGDERVKLVVDGQWRGLPHRLNQAVQRAQGRYFARMDADDVAFPERLARQIAFLDGHPDVSLVGTRAIAFAEDEKAIGTLPFAAAHEDIVAKPWLGFPLPHPTWMGRREWFLQWGYRESAVRCEDQDLLLRAHAQSRFACLPEILLGYRQPLPSARNVWLGRLHYTRALCEYAWQRRLTGLILRGLVAQTFRGVAVMAALAAGNGEAVLKRRFLRASDAEVDAWQRCLARLPS
jgi:glycosyltransferase involved in cell wall biosynthesis